MNQAQDEVVQLLTLDDEAYFAIGEDELLELQSRVAGLFSPELLEEMPVVEDETPETALAIGAPKTIAVDRQTRIPVLAACRYTGQRGWEVRYNQNFWLIASNLDDGTVRLVRPLLKDKRQRTPPPSGSGTPPNEVSAVSVTTSVRLFDPQANLLLEWRPMRLAFTALVYDWVSNTVQVDVTGKFDDPPRPAPMLPSTIIKMSESHPSHADSAGGLTVSIPESGSPDGPVIVQGALDVPAAQVTVAPSAGADGESVVPVSLFLLTLDTSWPSPANLVVPVTLAESQEGTRAQATFSFDLTEAFPEEDLSGTYLVYFVTGAVVSGPHAIVFDGG